MPRHWQKLPTPITPALLQRSPEGFVEGREEQRRTWKPRLCLMGYGY